MCFLQGSHFMLLMSMGPFFVCRRRKKAGKKEWVREIKESERIWGEIPGGKKTSLVDEEEAFGICFLGTSCWDFSMES
ncbi:hypothetical protein XELAEV_18035367mg [Xenopus laevis]|uniref:Uncharacterized protein n=1 Tax=Xenopus laevis TaxID=8355 RepID=A0A974CFS5_XENLA|nr:hypothetical protein XELAEV_18035367mg [Xenopus laevis]